ncbi:DUF6632 domain-containing protein [Novosphingobium tardum]|uniref:DUF6632 domain-containing protein n=1 Tax=Novosphingobium tardum TaxID=1538021 RepID=A0ABV8RU41_9SPHN
MVGKYSYLQIAMVLFGIVFCLVYPLAIVWPSGWAWHEGPPAADNYFLMIVGIYLTLGVMLILGARDPLANASLIRFTVASSVVHAAIMAVESYGNPMHGGHLTGDVPALLLVALVLGPLLARERGAGGERAGTQKAFS